MKNKLILVEGIPGSGKSTTSSKIANHLKEKGVNVKLFNEGDSHPADMAWNAYIPMDEYNNVLENNPKYASSIRENSVLEENYALVAYTKLNFSPEDKELVKFFQAHEVSDGRASLEVFKKLHFKRWTDFGQNVDGDSVVIFECSYLQNHVNELMGAHNKDKDFIISYMLDLIKTVKHLNPKLIYLSQENVRETISRVSKERVSSDKENWPDWIDMVIKYVEDSEYGKVNNLKGFDGVIKFFEDRKKIEFSVIDKLDIDKSIVVNTDYNWNDVFTDVLKALEE